MILIRNIENNYFFTFFGHCSWAFCRMRRGVCRRWEKGWALYRWACTGIPKSEPVPIRHFSCTHFCPLSLSKHLQISNPKGITNSYSYSRRQLKSIVLSESKRNLIQQHYCCKILLLQVLLNSYTQFLLIRLANVFQVWTEDWNTCKYTDFIIQIQYSKDDQNMYNDD